MARTILYVFLGGLTTLALHAPAIAQSVADFYKGKTINIIVGFGPGGGYDLYPRVLARHFSRHMPGNPTMVVQNMEGVGSARAANHVFAVAPKDGTYVAAVNQNMPMYQLLGGAGAVVGAVACGLGCRDGSTPKQASEVAIGGAGGGILGGLVWMLLSCASSRSCRD